MAFGDKDATATLERYRAEGAALIVVKDGVRPTLFRAPFAHGQVPVVPAGTVVDTTGAGDSFNGAFLAALMTGSPQVEAIALAQRVSAHVVGQRGALVEADQLAQLAGQPAG